MSKYYFCDTGVRNGLISNINSLENRDDVGQLWENFIMKERRKRNAYLAQDCNSYFWRTYTQQEIELVEEREGTLFPYAFKWSSRKPPIQPSEWLLAYPKAQPIEVIHSENFVRFLQ